MDLYNSIKLSCLSGLPPLQIQNISSWKEKGCLPGFLCPQNSATHLPQYCTPTRDCMINRTEGGMCAPQGVYEPVVCPPGWYCPSNAVQPILCPKGFYCPIGSKEPRKCTSLSVCPSNSMRHFDLTPLTILLFVDIMLVAALMFRSLQKKFIQRRKKPVLTIMRDEGNDVEMFIESLKRCHMSPPLGLSFDFKSLEFRSKRPQKVSIVKELSGTIKQGSLWGIMGASGCGKSTFIKLLMGKISGNKGRTTVNGISIRRFKKSIGYVPQDDIILADMTVRENILHSARMRLPHELKYADVLEHIDTLIGALHLSHIQNSLVGCLAKPIISGGQRKRVSIAIELAAAPMALFLDEPTSGLDTTAALSLLNLLHKLADSGMTIILIIHQPSQEIFNKIDNLMLLGDGQVIYQGEREKMKGHFEAAGFKFPENINTADVMGDIIAGKGLRYKVNGTEISIPWLIGVWKMANPKIPQRQTKVSDEHEHRLKKIMALRGARFHEQIGFNMIRSMMQQKRNVFAIVFELATASLAGLLIGLCYYFMQGHLFQGPFHEPYELLSPAAQYTHCVQIALLSFLAIGLVSSAPGVNVFGTEKLVYFREAGAGHLRSAYYIAKVLCTLPRVGLACFHFTTFCHLLSTPEITFGAAYSTNILYWYCIYGFASCISMLTLNEIAPLLAVMASLIIGIVSGTAPNLARVRSWKLEWFWRSSPGTWAGEAYFDRQIGPMKRLYNTTRFVDYMGYRMGRFRKDLAILFVIGTVYRLVAFCLMILIYRHRQN